MIRLPFFRRKPSLAQLVEQTRIRNRPWAEHRAAQLHGERKQRFVRAMGDA